MNNEQGASKQGPYLLLVRCSFFIVHFFVPARAASGTSHHPQHLRRHQLVQPPVAHQPLGDDRHLAWTFQDRGPGLNEAEARHLFDPFFCGRQAGRGLGLGLPRAARFVDRCWGQLSWRSAPGRGTTFTITLPAAEQSAVTADDPERKIA